MRSGKSAIVAGVAVAAAISAVAPVLAQSSSPFSGLFGGGDSLANSPVAFELTVGEGGARGLEGRLRTASLTAAALRDGRTSGQDVLAAARADYARLLGLLYDEGHFSAAIDIRLDGREAATIAPLDAPEVVRRVSIAVRPDARFTFSRAGIAPVAPRTDLPRDYRAGAIAGTGIIKDAAAAGVEGWREDGHAKADLADEQIVANHATDTIDSRLTLAPGPVVTFGELNVRGLQRLREGRLREIADLPTGARFSPGTLDAVRRRLRRTGVFSAITLDEAETLGPGNSMDINLTVIEQKPRRIGGGIELSNQDGAAVSGYWLHRNLWGGAEQFRIDGRVSDIGAGGDGQDYKLDMRLQRPATFGRDFTAFAELGVARLREDDADSDTAYAGVGLDYFRSDKLAGSVGLQYRASRVTDANGTTDFRLVALPLNGTWDHRDSATDPKAGFWLRAELTPFRGLQDDTGSGLRTDIEARAYRSFGAEQRLTFAARGRAGSVFGSEIGRTPRDYLFYSGGGGTVRGQPFQSLGVEVIPGPDGPIKTGGMSIVNASAEVRFQVRERIGLAVFADAGKVWAESGWKGDSGWQAGAGLGARYLSPIGPIRFDVAWPTGSSEPKTGDGVQLYLGLGQAF